MCRCLTAGLVLLCALAGGCSSSPEAMAEQRIKALEEVADAAEKKEPARADRAIKRYADLTLRLTERGSDERATAAVEKHHARQKELMARIGSLDPELMTKLLQATAEVQNKRVREKQGK
jgi:hypothetical protein